MKGRSVDGLGQELAMAAGFGLSFHVLVLLFLQLMLQRVSEVLDREL
jgi:hypothetical protein